MGDSDERTTDPVVYIGAPQDEQDDGANREDNGAATASIGRHWRPALTRWLLTLNSGRTQDEYEKAARYFFETPGVPQDLADLSFDLLLAYRGALALRADRRRHSMPRRAATSGRLGLRHPGAWAGALPDSASGSGFTASESAAGATFTPASQRIGPLSPATVNIRLTALRQFLLFTIEQGLLTTLTAEQTRSALRRLRNDRRRPYQMLAEDEWQEFLQAALTPPSPSSPSLLSSVGVHDAAPHEDVDQRPTAPTQPARAIPRGPWGVTRAAREQARQQLVEEVEAPTAPADSPTSNAAKVARAHDGRTGARTAQRDHALISLALATGLRAIELSLLDVGDLVSERRRGQTEWWLSLPDEKTKGQRGGRMLPLAPELMATLLAYIRLTGRAWEQPAYRATPLFLALERGRPSDIERTPAIRQQAVMTPDGEPERRYRRLRPEQIRGVIHRVEAQWLAQRRAASDDPAEAAEARRISPHTLRHSAAIALLLGDETTERPPASVEHVRGWLGHFDIRTTQRYLAHLESREQRRRFAIRPQSQRPPDTPAPTPEGEVGEQPGEQRG